MTDCVDCGKKLNFFNKSMENGVCAECVHKRYVTSVADLRKIEEEQKAIALNAETQLKQEIDAVLLTTETAPNLNIVKRIEIVTAECAYGMNIFKDLFAGVRDIVGGRSEAVQKTMRDARRTALYELKKEAHAVGANAVVGVDLDYVELSAAGSMVMLVASGTAVIIED